MQGAGQEALLLVGLCCKSALFCSQLATALTKGATRGYLCSHESCRRQRTQESAERLSP